MLPRYCCTPPIRTRGQTSKNNPEIFSRYSCRPLSRAALAALLGAADPQAARRVDVLQGGRRQAAGGHHPAQLGRAPGIWGGADPHRARIHGAPTAEASRGGGGINSTCVRGRDSSRPPPARITNRLPASRPPRREIRLADPASRRGWPPACTPPHARAQAKKEAAPCAGSPHVRPAMPRVKAVGLGPYQRHSGVTRWLAATDAWRKRLPGPGVCRASLVRRRAGHVGATSSPRPSPLWAGLRGSSPAALGLLLDSCPSCWGPSLATPAPRTTLFPRGCQSHW